MSKPYRLINQNVLAEKKNKENTSVITALRFQTGHGQYPIAPIFDTSKRDFVVQKESLIKVVQSPVKRIIFSWNRVITALWGIFVGRVERFKLKFSN